ncbi:MAG: KamA family protein [Bacteroidales bacterium]|nr:KamA family protein [Bacteroidales bacterium]
MQTFQEQIRLNLGSLKIVRLILKENPFLKTIFKTSETYGEAKAHLRQWLLNYFEKHLVAYDYYKHSDFDKYTKLSWEDYAAIRLMDYLDHDSMTIKDPNYSNELTISAPIKQLWFAAHNGKGNGKEDLFWDLLFLFRQMNGKLERNIPDRKKITKWMTRHPSGLDHRLIKRRKESKDRIIRKIVENIDTGIQKSNRFQFLPGSSQESKYQQVSEWWKDYHFHLSFAIRKPDILNDLLDQSLPESIMKRLYAALEKGIPLFVTPHYLSLLSVQSNPLFPAAEEALRNYIFPSQKLISTFGNIVAWEKEDIVHEGEPNAAGWLLPGFHNIHRRYPEVAILIPDTTGRACGGLCVSCQRMYDFQSGHFTFDLSRLKQKTTWPDKLELLMGYFENDSHLRDILITGGDAFMNNDNAMAHILDAVYNMAVRKKKANHSRKEGEKYAEIMRVRLGTRLPVYIPQRITDNFIKILHSFKEKAKKIGIEQFIIQIHIESAAEITPETRDGIHKLLQAGWMVTNQQVFTTAASLRGHTTKLRKVLNDLGVMTYYTFSVKGFMENYHNFATNARLVQEKEEEKYFGVLPDKYNHLIQTASRQTQTLKDWLNRIRDTEEIPFIATDRNIMNLPGVGKSHTFRVIGITNDGRRILRFKYDTKRNHSPAIEKTDVVIVESKPISKYLRQLEKMGQNINEYQSIWGYSLNETEEWSPVFQYPKYPFKITEKYTNVSQSSPEIKGVI